MVQNKAEEEASVQLGAVDEWMEELIYNSGGVNAGLNAASFQNLATEWQTEKKIVIKGINTQEQKELQRNPWHQNFLLLQSMWASGDWFIKIEKVCSGGKLRSDPIYQVTSRIGVKTRLNTGVVESPFKENLDSVPVRRGFNTDNEMLLKQLEELESHGYFLDLLAVFRESSIAGT